MTTNKLMQPIHEGFKRIITSWRTPKKTPTLGLALGGGGVRGLAHAGVLTVFEREGIPIHAIAGTSMGAIIAGAYVLSPDFNSKHLAQQAIDLGISTPARSSTVRKDQSTFLERLRLFIDVERFLFDSLWGWGTLPEIPVADALAKLTLGKGLEEGKIPIAVVATNLHSGEKVVFKEGPATIALQASAAIPGFFPPVLYQGSLLADGGFIELVPASVVRQMGVDLVIAVDVNQDNVRVEINNGLQALLRAVDISAHHHKHHYLELADLVIRPEFGEAIDTLDFAKIELCINAGMRAAERAIPDVRRLLSKS